MSTLSLQKELSSMISKVDDLSLLKSIKSILNSQNEHQSLSKIQKKLIDKSEKDILNGDLIEHTKAMNTIADQYGW